MIIMDIIKDIINWSNTNSGFLALLIFVISIIIGWVSGIFTHIKRKPKFSIDLIKIPSFICPVATGREKYNLPTYRTAIVLYLDISNVGTAPAAIKMIRVRYKTKSNNYLWLNQINALEDFTAEMNEHVKVYPFFTQNNNLMKNDSNRYLREGDNKSGIEYFESDEYWGNFDPKTKNGNVKIKIEITDSYNSKHYKIVDIPLVDIEKAQKFNKKIGLAIEYALMN